MRCARSVVTESCRRSGVSISVLRSSQLEMVILVSLGALQPDNAIRNTASRFERVVIKTSGNERKSSRPNLTRPLASDM